MSSWIPYRRREIVEDDAHERWDSESPNARPRPPKIGRRKYTSERGLHDVWRDAMPGAVVLDVKPPRQASADGDSMSAGIYLAKYVTKGIDSAEFTGRKAGELLCAFRGKRKVSTSAGFWDAKDPTCECCKEPFRSDGAPMSLQELNPAAVLRSQAIRTSRPIRRGHLLAGRFMRLRPDEQSPLRWDEN